MFGAIWCEAIMHRESLDKTAPGATKETSQEIYKIAFVVVGPWNTLPKLVPNRVGISFPTD